MIVALLLLLWSSLRTHVHLQHMRQALGCLGDHPRRDSRRCKPARIRREVNVPLVPPVRVATERLETGRDCVDDDELAKPAKRMVLRHVPEHPQHVVGAAVLLEYRRTHCQWPPGCS